MDFACVPDIHFEPVSTLTDGPHVVTELRITGTNTGPTALGISGRRS
jgi:predicted ester cyclase